MRETLKDWSNVGGRRISNLLGAGNITLIVSDEKEIAELIENS